jgi:hypothetical protein
MRAKREQGIHFWKAGLVLRGLRLRLLQAGQKQSILRRI